MPILLHLLLALSPFSSGTPPDFSSVDSVAKTVRYRGNLDYLARQLTAPYTQPLPKARAIFIWITDNIAYDYKHCNHLNFRGEEERSFSCSDDKDCAARKEAWETKYVDRVLRRKKALCEGYALLFKKMCQAAGLTAEIITGYTRSKDYQIEYPFRPPPGPAFSCPDHPGSLTWILPLLFLECSRRGPLRRQLAFFRTLTYSHLLSLLGLSFGSRRLGGKGVDQRLL